MILFHDSLLFPAPWVAFLTVVIAVLVFKYCNNIDQSFFLFLGIFSSYFLVGVLFYLSRSFWQNVYDNDRELFTTLFQLLFLYEKVIAIFAVNCFGNVVTMPPLGEQNQVSLPVKMAVKGFFFAFVVLFSGSSPGSLIPGCRVRGFSFICHLFAKGWLKGRKR